MFFTASFGNNPISICQARTGFPRKPFLSLPDSLITCSSQLYHPPECQAGISLQTQLILLLTPQNLTVIFGNIFLTCFSFCSSSSPRASGHTPTSSIAPGSKQRELNQTVPIAAFTSHLELCTLSRGHSYYNMLVPIF